MSNADISIPCLAGVLNNVQQNPYICWNWQASWFVLHQGHVWGCNCAIKGKGKLFPLLQVMPQQPQWMYLDLCHFSRWHRAKYTRADLGSFCASEEQGFDQVQLPSPSPACCSLPTVWKTLHLHWNTSCLPPPHPPRSLCGLRLASTPRWPTDAQGGLALAVLSRIVQWSSQRPCTSICSLPNAVGKLHW